MQQKYAFGLAIFLALAPSVVLAAQPFGANRGLQAGPVGDAPAAISAKGPVVEGQLDFTRTYGSYKVNGEEASKVEASYVTTKLAAGAYFPFGKTFALSTYLEGTLISDGDLDKDRTEIKQHLDYGMYDYELALFAWYRGAPLVVGGGPALIIVKSEEREFVYDETQEFTNDVGSATIPIVRVFAGIEVPSFAAILGFRSFGRGEVEVEAEDASGNKHTYDSLRRRPAEVHVDSRIKLKLMRLTGSVAYVLTGQASDRLYDNSMEYVADGTKERREDGGDLIEKNHVRAGLGVRMEPVKAFAFSSGVQYIQESYAKPEYASLEKNNLGGTRTDVAGEAHFGIVGVKLGVGYTVGKRRSYEVEDDDQDKTKLLRTQRPSLRTGDRVKAHQDQLELVLAGSAAF